VTVLLFHLSATRLLWKLPDYLPRFHDSRLGPQGSSIMAFTVSGFMGWVWGLLRGHVRVSSSPHCVGIIDPGLGFVPTGQVRG
jgi:hypothetical protein